MTDAGEPRKIGRLQLADYLDDVASSSPTPGGGSVGGVVAALAAGLGEMVGNLTKPGADGMRPDVFESALARLGALRADALALAEADEAAYAGYRAASSMPKVTDEEKSRRSASLQDALLIATEVPLALAACSVDILQALEPITRHGNPHALSDALLGSLLAKAAGEGALLNVRGNAGMIRDSAFAGRALAAADRLEQALAGARAAVVSAANR
ncbi:MAG: cyclodeaminase/cyclohydrolase family protein [Chloroflexota bacterium]